MVLPTCKKEKHITFNKPLPTNYSMNDQLKCLVPMQFPKAGQWWSNPLILDLQLLQYLTLENDGEFC